MKNKFLSVATSVSILALSASALYAMEGDQDLNNEAGTSRIHKSISHQITPQEGLQLACRNHPKVFSNFGDLDQQNISAFVREYLGVHPKTFIHIDSTHFDSLIPLLRNFQRYINGISDVSEDTAGLIEDINGDIEYVLKPRKTTKKPIVTIPFFLDVHNRFIASLGAPSEEEKAVFWHATNPEHLLGLHENDAWKTPLKAFAEIDQFDNKGEDATVFSTPLYLSHYVVQLIEGMVDDKVYPYLHYPMLGQDKLGVPFLTLNAIRRTHPFAYSPANDAGAHGLDRLTPAAMTAHDFVHADLDQRINWLKKHIVDVVDNKFPYFEGTDVSAKQLVEMYAPVAIERFLRIERTFEWFFDQLVAEVLPKRGLEEFNKIMAGFFWVMREQVGFHGKLFEMGSLVEIIDHYADTSLSKLNDQDSSWEVTSNPFLTNSFDGKSAYTDEEIVEVVSRDEQIQLFGPIAKASVEYTPRIEYAPLAPKYRFIDVNLEFRNGHKERISYTTMLHRLKNIEDARGLLRAAGLNVPEQPTLEGLSNEEASAVATVYIDTVRHQIEDSINLFRTAFKHFVTLPSKGSLDKKYAKWVQKQVAELDRHFRTPLRFFEMNEQTTWNNIRLLEENRRELERLNEIARASEERYALLSEEFTDFKEQSDADLQKIQETYDLKYAQIQEEFAADQARLRNQYLEDLATSVKKIKDLQSDLDDNERRKIEELMRIAGEADSNIAEFHEGFREAETESQKAIDAAKAFLAGWEEEKE